MNFDLEKVGIEAGPRYECIYTTISSKKEKNAAAIGFKYLGKNKIGCRIFEGSKTLENIQETKRFVVNITQDPLIFTYSTIDKLNDDYYTKDEDIAILKDVPAYMIVDVLNIEEMSPDDFPEGKDDKIYMIQGEIKDFVINNKCAKALNRAIPSLIECLVNYTRFNIVDDEKREDYLGRLEENQRIINKVGDEKTKKAIEILNKKYME